MRLSGFAKWGLYDLAPLFCGRFAYCEHTVYFPLKSHIFERACSEGIYEQEIVNLILSVVQPGTTYMDVGANIGLLSVPILAACPTVKVVSIEAAPETLKFLRKTHKIAPRGNDWTVVGVAVGAETGEAEFWTGTAAWGAFDGLRDTGRGGSKRPVRVPVRTLDDIWLGCGRPEVSVIKIDIEGGELPALLGARALIIATKPTIVIEWTNPNLRAYGIHSDALLQLSADLDYLAYAFPSFVLVDTIPILQGEMAKTETFVLAPREKKI